MTEEPLLQGEASNEDDKELTDEVDNKTTTTQQPQDNEDEDVKKND